LWVATIDIIQFAIGVVGNDVGIRESYYENPMPATPWGRSRALMKEADRHRKATRKAITEAL
jgi:hypothetical protein